MSKVSMSPQDVLAFWFDELQPAQWWEVDPAVDERIRQRFSDLHAAANAAELYEWRATPDGRLAEIIVLDQFSRNIHRGTPGAFASDGMALVLAQEAVAQGVDDVLPVERVAFLYLPFMHSESAHIHVLAERLYKRPGLESNYKFELAHKVIIDRFGRYPHRNQILGRASSPEEIEFLKTPGSSF